VVGFGILWFFVALSVESSLFPIRDVMNEHRMYLAMPGVSLVAASLFTAAVRRRPAVSFALGGAVAALLCALTFARNEVWQTQLSLWMDALQKSPDKARVHVNVGTALQLEGRLDEAIPYYCRALEIDPKSARAHYHLEVVLEQKADEGTIPMDVESAGADGSVVLVPRNPCRRR
jgi:tetratricopeptide (TPR) repeat protein